MTWHPIGTGDIDVWIETEEDREQQKKVEEEVLIETEEEVENETDKEEK